MTRVAVVRAASIPFDSAATVAKAEGLIAQCATGGAELAAFPEAVIGCYPKDTRRRSPVVFSDSSSAPNPTAGIADADER